MFTLYLDIQKHIDIDELLEDELRGRWKSFVGKWNRGELAEGWYDPRTLEKSIATTSSSERPSSSRAAQRDPTGSDDEFGPVLPDQDGPCSTTQQPLSYRAGPTIPSIQDLQFKHEQENEDADEEQSRYRKQTRYERKVDRNLQKEYLDNLVPKAEAGTRERQLEKKRERADSNRAFASAKEGGGEMELPDADVMGDTDSVGDLKRIKKEQERKKNDREIRREEVLRARIAEREERVAGMREKEKKTMDMLKELARARFGAA